MHSAARQCVAATAALAAGVIAGMPVMTPSPPEVRSPAVQITGDSSVFLPLPAGDPGFDKAYFDGLLTVDKDFMGPQGDFAGQMISGASGSDAIVHETDLLQDSLTNLFNANGVVLDPGDAASLAGPQLGLDPSAINGSSLAPTEGGSSQLSSLAATQGLFFTSGIANAMSAVAVDLSQLQAAVTTLNADLVTAGGDFAGNFVTQGEALATALEQFNAVAFAAALQNLIDIGAFDSVVNTDLPAIAQALMAFGDLSIIADVLGTASMLGS